MLIKELEESRQRARRALDGATSDNIIELCKQYLAQLAEYRAGLFNLRDTLGINRPAGSLLPEGVGGARKAVRAALETVMNY